MAPEGMETASSASATIEHVASPKIETPVERESSPEAAGAELLVNLEDRTSALDTRAEEIVTQGRERFDIAAASELLPSEDAAPFKAEAEKAQEEFAQEAAGAKQQTRSEIAGTVGKWMKESPLLKTVLISAALHVPFSPYGKELMDSLKDHGAEVPETVLRPQGYDNMLETADRKAKREERVDADVVSSYKKDMRERMEKGEPVSFEELYLDLERLNGVSPERVERAKQEAHGRIERYSREMGEEIDPDELRSFVGEMYGVDSNYDWGQASVAEYFESGKRNCVAIAKAEAIVLEGVIRNLPPEARQRYEIGINKMKQHEVAALTIRSKDGSSFQTFMLEGGVATLEGARETEGTKTVSLDLLKQGIVSEKPIAVQAKAGEIQKSPDLLVVTDQPVDDGIDVQGDLRGSEYVVQQAELQGVKPEIVQQPAKEPMEVEILDEGPQGPEVVATLERDTNLTYILDARRLVNPTPEAVKALVPRLKQENSFEVQLPDLTGWPEESVQELFETDLHYLNIPTTQENELAPALMDLLKKRVSTDNPEKLPLKSLKMLPGPTEEIPHYIPTEQLQTLVQGLKGIDRIDFSDFGSIFMKEAKIVSQAPVKEIELIASDEEVIRFLAKAKPKIIFRAADYLYKMDMLTDLVRLENIEPNIDMANPDELVELHQRIKKEAPQRKKLLFEIEQMLGDYQSESKESKKTTASL
ncbi:hypothetical protein HY479_02455 [Candidatus Uhrbacteria bacterium]|nr:hypothetical protein [Candidatus Uhrbacteria bacterium]